MLDIAEEAGIFAGYLEDLVYAPKTLKAVQAVRAGQIGQVTWARSRETHPGPHSAWFWDAEQAGGGAIVDLGCHCIEIVRSYMGKDNRPLEVMAWTDTLVHPIEAEDNAICLIRFESGAIGQFEVSWTFRGGMDLRDEVAGTEGTIWTNHFLRTGFEMFSSGEGAGYVAEKAESASGWLFPVGDEVAELGYVDMFTDMFDALDEGRAPTETFYDGYVVNSVMDACYASAASRQWEPVRLDDWRGGGVEPITRTKREHDGRTVDQGGADAGRPPEADPQGRDDRRLLRRRRLTDGSTRRRSSSSLPRAEPTPTATAPASRNARAFVASTPPVATSGTSRSGASTSWT